jgi:hypothetical protein
MNDHLTSQQINEFVAGAAAPALEEHVHACNLCRAEADRLSDTLALFRDAARNWSVEQQSARPLISVDLNASPHRSVNFWHLGWTTAALAACLIAGLALPRQHAAKPVPAHTTVAPISDAELLGRVDRELSETVAPSLQPIALNEVKN